MKRTPLVLGIVTLAGGVAPPGAALAARPDLPTARASGALVEAAVRAPVRIGSVVVSLGEQRAYVYSRSRRLVATLPVSTGLFDSTPTGSFRVFSRSAQTYYAPSPDERMKWMVRFTQGARGDNIGFHGIPYRVTSKGDIPFPTPLGRAPSSHGCVRMAVADARWLFENLPQGAPVRVVRGRGN